jgi:hypothetical protein
MSKHTKHTPPTRRIDDEVRKDAMLVIRMTAHDRARLHATAARRGLTVSDMVRSLADTEEYRRTA